MSVEIYWQAVELDEVIRHYTKEFDATVRHVDWYVDTARGEVIFKLMTEAPIFAVAEGKAHAFVENTKESAP